MVVKVTGRLLFFSQKKLWQCHDNNKIVCGSGGLFLTWLCFSSKIKCHDNNKIVCVCVEGGGGEGDGLTQF
jgi:hypothetical protein